MNKNVILDVSEFDVSSIRVVVLLQQSRHGS